MHHISSAPGSPNRRDHYGTLDTKGRRHATLLSQLVQS